MEHEDIVKTPTKSSATFQPNNGAVFQPIPTAAAQPRLFNPQLLDGAALARIAARTCYKVAVTKCGINVSPPSRRTPPTIAYHAEPAVLDDSLLCVNWIPGQMPADNLLTDTEAIAEEEEQKSPNEISTKIKRVAAPIASHWRGRSRGRGRGRGRGRPKGTGRGRPKADRASSSSTITLEDGSINSSTYKLSSGSGSKLTASSGRGRGRGRGRSRGRGRPRVRVVCSEPTTPNGKQSAGAKRKLSTAIDSSPMEHITSSSLSSSSSSLSALSDSELAMAIARAEKLGAGRSSRVRRAPKQFVAESSDQHNKNKNKQAGRQRGNESESDGG